MIIRTAIRAFQNLWNRLTEIPAVTDAPSQQQRRFLASLLISLVGFALLMLTVYWAVMPLADHSDGYVTLLALAALTVAYFFNRAGNYPVAISILVVTSFVTVFVLGFPFYGPAHDEYLSYLFIPVLIASVFLPLKAGLLVSLLSPVVILVLGVLSGTDLKPILSGPFLFMLLVIVVVWIVIYPHKRLEMGHQGQIRVSESRLQLITDNMQDIICLADPDRIFTYVSPSLLSIVGFDPARAVGQPLSAWLDRVHPDDRHQTKQEVEKVLAKAAAGRCEYRWQHQAGHYLWIETIIQVLKSKDETAGSIVLGSRDVTERKQAEERLRANEITYRQLVAFSPEPMLIYDGDVIVFCNTAAAGFLGGRNAGQLLGASLLDFVHPDNRQTITDYLHDGLHRKTVFRDVEHKLTRLDAEVIDVEISGMPITYQGRAALQIVYRDIVRHKQQQAMEHSRRIMAEISRDTAAALHGSLSLDEVLDRLLNLLTGILPYDAASIRLMKFGVPKVVMARGYTDETGTGILSHSIDALPFLRQVSEEQRPLVLPTVQSDAGWVAFPGAEWIRSHITAPIYLDADLIGFISLDSAQSNAFTEESAGKLQAFAEQAGTAVQNALLFETIQHSADRLEEMVQERTAELSRAKERAEAILRNTSDAIILLQAQGTIQEVNPAFTTLFGYSGSTMRGQPLADLFAPKSAAVFQDALLQVRSTDQMERIELSVCRQDGTVFTADAVLTSIGHDHDQPTMVCSLRDITVRKQVEEELRKALKRERELNELKSQFTSMVSHEFRTPLAVILTSSDLLKLYYERLTVERRREHLEMIQTQVKHLVNMLEDALMMGTSQTVNLNFQPSPVDLAQLCHRALQDFQHTFHPAQPLHFENKCHEPEAMADEKLFSRLVNNLLSNAVKYSSQNSPITLHLSGDADQIRLCVQDEGVGVPPEEQGRIFDVFYRGSNVSHISGIGLGLALVKEIVTLHHGAIHVESELGIGTTFVIQLPRFVLPETGQNSLQSTKE